MLEGAQAGLSWLTILRKREGYRAGFRGLRPERVAAFDEGDVQRLLADPRIVRNRLKIEAAIGNARAFLRGAGGVRQFRQPTFGDLSEARQSRTSGRAMAEIPAKTPEAERMSADLKKRGFRFVGPTICYAHMQATGMVNDHTVDCFRYRNCGRTGFRGGDHE